jgi:hypothetical protein
MRGGFRGSFPRRAMRWGILRLLPLPRCWKAPRHPQEFLFVCGGIDEQTELALRCSYPQLPSLSCLPSAAFPQLPSSALSKAMLYLNPRRIMTLPISLGAGDEERMPELRDESTFVVLALSLSLIGLTCGIQIMIRNPNRLVLCLWLRPSVQDLGRRRGRRVLIGMVRKYKCIIRYHAQ